MVHRDDGDTGAAQPLLGTSAAAVPRGYGTTVDAELGVETAVEQQRGAASPAQPAAPRFKWKVFVGIAALVLATALAAIAYTSVVTPSSSLMRSGRPDVSPQQHVAEAATEYSYEYYGWTVDLMDDAADLQMPDLKLYQANKAKWCYALGCDCDGAADDDADDGDDDDDGDDASPCHLSHVESARQRHIRYNDLETDDMKELWREWKGYNGRSYEENSAEEAYRYAVFKNFLTRVDHFNGKEMTYNNTDDTGDFIGAIHAPTMFSDMTRDEFEARWTGGDEVQELLANGDEERYYQLIAEKEAHIAARSRKLEEVHRRLSSKNKKTEESKATKKAAKDEKKSAKKKVNQPLPSPASSLYQR